MKRTITIIDKTGKKDKVIKHEFNVPDKNILEARLTFKAQTFTPKKGKGSFKRNKKVSIEDWG